MRKGGLFSVLCLALLQQCRPEAGAGDDTALAASETLDRTAITQAAWVRFGETRLPAGSILHIAESAVNHERPDARHADTHAQVSRTDIRFMADHNRDEAGPPADSALQALVYAYGLERALGRKFRDQAVSPAACLQHFLGGYAHEAALPLVQQWCPDDEQLIESSEDELPNDLLRVTLVAVRDPGYVELCAHSREEGKNSAELVQMRRFGAVWKVASLSAARC